jgi:hemoglobin-like flavoprotein
MKTDPVATTKASYSRCLESPDFLGSFYQEFFKTCPDARALFSHTDFDRQTRLLQHAIGLLIAFPNEPVDGPSVLDRLAAKHGPKGLNIQPSWYPLFLDSLVRTVARHDPEFSTEIAQAWQDALTPGIDYMVKYR